jgi:hypothetical protein
VLLGAFAANPMHAASSALKSPVVFFGARARPWRWIAVRKTSQHESVLTE